MASTTGLAWSNEFKIGTVTAGSSEPSLGPTNLASDQCSAATGWQTISGVLTAVGGATLRVSSPSTGMVWRMVGLFRTNLTPQASITVILWSGVTAVFTRTVSGPAVGYGQVVVVLDRDYTGDYVTVDINDPTNPDGFINVAGAFAGPAWFPLSGITWDSAYSFTEQFDASVSRGGNEYVILLYRRRVWKLALDTIRDSEAWASLAELLRIASLGGNVLFVPDTASVDLYREALFGRLTSTADVTFPQKLMDARAWRGQVTERL